MDIEKHYQRKEHALFSFLEKNGSAGPSKVMWAKDDDIRASLKRMNQAAHDCRPTVRECKKLAAASVAPALVAVEEIIFKEENILLPKSLQTLTDNEWAEIWASSSNYGWCLLGPRQRIPPPKHVGASTPVVPGDGTITMPTGNITVEQLPSVLSTLPLDLTFVGADERVAFFTEGAGAHFRPQQSDHRTEGATLSSPERVAVVDRILGDFRAGRQHVAEFWIDFRGKFVHIRYFAVRDKEGQYLGTVELTQDIAPLRGLTGERRLLQYN